MPNPKYKLTVSGEVTYSKKDQLILDLLLEQETTPEQLSVAFQELEERSQNTKVTVRKIEVPDSILEPMVPCSRDNKSVPIWYCLGSPTQGRETCPYLLKATIHGGKWAEVECKT